jgi:hypothetical protein
MAVRKCFRCGKVMKLVVKNGYGDHEYEDYENHLVPGDCLTWQAEQIRELKEQVAGLTELMKHLTKTQTS